MTDENDNHPNDEQQDFEMDEMDEHQIDYEQPEDHPEEQPVGRQPNMEEIRETVSPATEDDKQREIEDAVYTLMRHPEEVVTTMRDLKTANVPGSQEHRDHYSKAINYGAASHPPHNSKVDPFGKEESFWRQAVEHQGEEIMAGKPRFSQHGGKLSGDSALLRVRAAAGLGTIVNVPLWHTGLWLKIKAPGEGTLLELERRIAMEKVVMGRQSSGVSFSNHSVYLNSYLVDMILNHVYDGTYHDLTPQKLKNVIKVTDIPQLVWGMACAIWPNGYRLVRPCVHDPNQCSHIDEAHINISKLSWTDNRALSHYQRNHMMNRDGDVTDDQLDNYAKEHTAPQHRKVSVGSEMAFRLKVPTIREYEQSGFQWVDEMVRMTDDAFGQSLRGDERNEYILQQAAMSNLRRYSHWIEEIVFSDDATAGEREPIDEALTGLTSDSKTRNELVNHIETFIRECVINAIGIPRYQCPSCGGEPHEDDLPHRLQEIIQLEVNEIFFTLQSMRVMKTLQGG